MRTGLMFMLRDGHRFVAFMLPDKAKTIIKKWLEGQYQQRLNSAPRYIGDVGPDNTAWAVDMDQVIGLDLVTVQEQQQPTYLPTPQKSWAGVSGVYP